MAPLTLRSFIDALEAISVSGVKRTYQGPPVKAETVELPSQWVQFPNVSDEPLCFGVLGGWPTVRAQLVIAYEAVAQSRQPTNFDGTVDMIDTLNTAIRAIAPNANLSGLWWTVRQSVVTVAGNTYWALIADIEGQGMTA
jgi:hypothetical protein